MKSATDIEINESDKGIQTVIRTPLTHGKQRSKLVIYYDKEEGYFLINPPDGLLRGAICFNPDCDLALSVTEAHHFASELLRILGR